MNRYFPAIPVGMTLLALGALAASAQETAPAQSAAPRNLTFEDFEAIKSPEQAGDFEGWQARRLRA